MPAILQSIMKGSVEPPLFVTKQALPFSCPAKIAFATQSCKQKEPWARYQWEYSGYSTFSPRHTSLNQRGMATGLPCRLVQACLVVPVVIMILRSSSYTVY